MSISVLNIQVTFVVLVSIYNDVFNFVILNDVMNQDERRVIKIVHCRYCERLQRSKRQKELFL